MTHHSRINTGLAFSIPSMLFTIWFASNPESNFRIFGIGGWVHAGMYCIIPWIGMFIYELILRQKKLPWMTSLPLFSLAYIVLFAGLYHISSDWNRAVRFSHYTGMTLRQLIIAVLLIYQLIACASLIFLAFIPKKKNFA